MPTVMNTGTDSAGGYIVDPLFQKEVQRLVYAKAQFLRLCTVLPVNRRSVHLHKLATGPSLSFIGEAEQKPSTSLTFGRDTATVEELAGICVWSDRLEAESFSNPQVRKLVASAVRDAAIDTIDSALFNGVPTSANPNIPTGLLQGSGHQTHTYGTGSDLGEDMRLMLRAVRSQNFEPSAFCVNSVVVDGLLAIRDSNDLIKYPSVNSLTPSIWGKPIVVANSISAGTANSSGLQASDVVLADWKTIVVCTMPISVRISDTAVVDSTSMFETDSTALRYVANVSSPVMRRPNAVCVMEDALA